MSFKTKRPFCFLSFIQKEIEVKKIISLLVVLGFSSVVFAEMLNSNMAAPSKDTNTTNPMPAADMNQTAPGTTSQNLAPQPDMNAKQPEMQMQQQQQQAPSTSM